MQGQISDRITRIADIDRLPRLIIIRQLPQIDHDLIIRRAAILYADVVHGGVDVVHAGLVRRSGRAAVVLGQPEAHDAAGARVGPLPLAGRGFGRVEEGAGVEGDGEAVVPGDIEAGAVVEEEGAVGGGAGDEGDGAGTGVRGCEGVLNEGAAGVEGVGGREEGGEEEEDEESEEGRIPHGAGFECICSLVIRGWRRDCQGWILGDVEVMKSGDGLLGGAEIKEKGGLTIQKHDRRDQASCRNISPIQHLGVKAVCVSKQQLYAERCVWSV